MLFFSSEVYPQLFLRVDDTIISIIEAKVIENPSPRLAMDVLGQCFEDRRSHRVYKCVEEVEIVKKPEDQTTDFGGDELWAMSEDDIKDELLALPGQYKGHDGETITLKSEDFYVEKREVHYGRKDKNPVSQMRFLESKADQTNLTKPMAQLPLAVKIENLPMNTPRAFLRRTIRFFSRDRKKDELLSHLFQK